MPGPLQCSHVEEQCPPRTTFLSIDYLHFYFCAGHALRPLIFIALVSWLIFLFSTLGISASDFFTPNLASIAQLLGLDENVAGVTFLAFGNGSPDLFSTLSAMRADSGSLAIGELLGAASFIVSCVVGSMCIIKPFRVHRAPFLRDVGFFAIAVGVVLFILYDGEIRMQESGLLVGMYVTYALIVVVGSWWEKRRERIREREALIRNEYGEDMPIFPPYSDERECLPHQLQLLIDCSAASHSGQTENGLLSVAAPTPARARAISTPVPPRLQISLPPRPKSRSPSPSPRISQLPSFSLVGALEFRDVVSSLQNQASGTSLNMFESPVTPYAGGHYHHRTLSTRSQSRPHSLHSSWHRDGENRIDMDGSLHLDHRRSAPSIIVSPGMPEDERSEPTDEYFTGPHGRNLEGNEVTNIPTIYRTPASPSSSESEQQLFAPSTKRQRVWRAIKQVLHTLFPTLHHFRDQSVLGKIASLVAAPAVMLLTLTLPVVVMRYENSHSSVEKPYAGGEGQLVGFEEEGVERVLIAEEEVEEGLHDLVFSKWLMAVQCVLGPLFCAGVLFSEFALFDHGIFALTDHSTEGNTYEGWIMMATAIAGFAIGVLVLIFSKNGAHPSARMARCSMGFFVAIVWIMAIADEVVEVLQVCFSISALQRRLSFLPDLWQYLWALRRHHRSDYLRRWQLSGRPGS